MQLIKNVLIEAWVLGNPHADGTFPSGYMMDSWGKWKLVCLLLLSVQVVDDIYVIGFLVSGFLLFGAGGFLMYCKFFALSAAIGKLPDLHMGMCRDVSAEIDKQSCVSLDTSTASLAVVL